jgi:hypothetical protein
MFFLSACTAQAPPADIPAPYRPAASETISATQTAEPFPIEKAASSPTPEPSPSEFPPPPIQLRSIICETCFFAANLASGEAIRMQGVERAGFWRFLGTGETRVVFLFFHKRRILATMYNRYEAV